MKSYLLLCFFIFILLAACGEEEKESLPPLKKIDLPQSVVGTYSGLFPCDDCQKRMERVELKEDSSAFVIQTTIKDTITTDTLTGSYSFNNDKLTIKLDNAKIVWNLKLGSYNSFALLTGAGTIYEDENGFKAELIKIYNNSNSSSKKENKE